MANEEKLYSKKLAGVGSAVVTQIVPSCEVLAPLLCEALKTLSKEDDIS